MDLVETDARKNLLAREACDLSAALVGRVASLLQVRALIVKGVSLERHGLRAGRISADVDVLVEPGRVAELSAALADTDWHLRPSYLRDEILATHSVTLIRDSWPTDLDLHISYPGLLVTDDVAFDTLWLSRQSVQVAGHRCWIPDWHSSIALWALHCLRAADAQPRLAAELLELRHSTLGALDERARHALADRIVELGADEPLRAVPEFAEIIGDRHGPQEPGALKAWQAKVAQAHEATPWLQLLRDARPSERPWLLFRAVWPSAHDLRLLDEALVDTPTGRVQSRGRRAWRLVRRIVERRRQAH